TRDAVVVFTEYRDTLQHLLRRLARPAVVLHGGLRPEERTEALRRVCSTPRALLPATHPAPAGLNPPHPCPPVPHPLPPPHRAPTWAWPAPAGCRVPRAASSSASAASIASGSGRRSTRSISSRQRPANWRCSTACARGLRSPNRTCARQILSPIGFTSGRSRGRSSPEPRTMHTTTLDLPP